MIASLTVNDILAMNATQIGGFSETQLADLTQQQIDAFTAALS
jgi:hypothetical protein